MLVSGIGRYSVLTGRCQDTSDPRHFGPKTFWHWCRSVLRTLRYWCRNVRKTLRYRSVFGVVCAIVCCDITIASRIGLAWRLCTRRNRFNAVYLKHDGTAIDWADRTASASHSRTVAAVSECRPRTRPSIRWDDCAMPRRICAAAALRGLRYCIGRFNPFVCCTHVCN